MSTAALLALALSLLALVAAAALLLLSWRHLWSAGGASRRGDASPRPSKRWPVEPGKRGARG